MRRHLLDPAVGWLYYADGAVEEIPAMLRGHPLVYYAWLEGVRSWAVRTWRIEPEDEVDAIPP